MSAVTGVGPTQTRARTEEASGEASESKRRKWVIKRSWSGSLNEGRWCIRTRGRWSSTSLSSVAIDGSWIWFRENEVRKFINAQNKSKK